MILNTKLSHDAEYIGDVQENRVGIDKNNIDFITTLLTSNLYSKPLESFFRETVSNAYDSHKEAGTDEPILILIEDTNTYCTYRISIRDYGVGVTPERFDQIYRNIGSSTKRESNSYIGMFGIGRFSCLSCADVANINSYCNGKKYSYIMYKNGGGINIDKLSEVEGDFKNGLEVSIEVNLFGFNALSASIQKLCLFDKLYIEYKGTNSRFKRDAEEFNNRKIKNYKNFSRCSEIISGRYFRVGNVIYDFPYDLKDSKGKKIELSTSNGIIINLPMGSVDITPNREALQYTDYTLNSIEQGIKEVKKEFSSIINSKIDKGLNLEDFCKNFVYQSWFTLHENDMNIIISRDDVDIDTSKCKIEGEQIPKDYITFLYDYKYCTIDKSLIHKAFNSNMRGRTVFSKNLQDLVSGNFNLITKEDKITKQVTMSYTKDNIDGKVVILINNGLEEYKNHIKDYSKNLGVNIDLQGCIDFTFKHLKMSKMANADVPEEYIKAFKNEHKTKKVKDLTKVPIRWYHSAGYTLSSLDNIPSTGLVLYCEHTKEDKVLKELACCRIDSIACIITLKQEFLKLVSHNRRYMTVTSFLYTRNSIGCKIATSLEIQKNFRETYNSNNQKGVFAITSIPIYKEFLKKYNPYLGVSEYLEFPRCLFSLYKSRGWMNEADIKYYSLSQKEINGLKNWAILISRKNLIIDKMAIKSNGELPKIGLSIKKLITEL